MPEPPASAYPPGTHLTVGSHEVEIVKFIGEGGFAHVYTVKASPPIPGQDICCLKRVQVPNKTYLNLLRAEVDAMQRLIGASNVVQYYDSHAERMRGSQGAEGQYEVFLLMEFCARGGLIDFMNQRLRDQLREHEILKIMYDITLGLAHMHYLRPPLLHRDLKIENVLIAKDGTFKLCDFGSVSPVLRPPKTPQELSILENDINHQTTVQYRAPEMINMSQGHPINEKSDIWALGVFLYKLCFYTTPFERPNQTLEQFLQLILTSSFSIPPRPAYSERLRNMIRVLLQPDPRLRPNVYQVMQEICQMRHVEIPIKDIYSQPAESQLAQQQQQAAPRPQALPITQPKSPVVAPMGSSSSIGTQVPQAQPVPQVHQAQTVPQVGHQAPQSGLQIPLTGSVSVPSEPASPLSGAADDDLAARFPSLEEIDSMTRRKAPPPKIAPRKSAQNLAAMRSSNTSASLPPKLPAKPPISSAAKPAVKPPINPAAKPVKPQVGQHNSRGEELQQILTGLNDKSSTVILDKPDSASLSSVDFLRTLRPGERKSASSAPAPTRYYESDDDDSVGSPQAEYRSDYRRYDSPDRYTDDYDIEDRYGEGEIIGSPIRYSGSNKYGGRFGNKYTSEKYDDDSLGREIYGDDEGDFGDQYQEDYNGDGNAKYRSSGEYSRQWSDEDYDNDGEEREYTKKIHKHHRPHLKRIVKPLLQRHSSKSEKPQKPGPPKPSRSSFGSITAPSSPTAATDLSTSGKPLVRTSTKPGSKPALAADQLASLRIDDARTKPVLPSKPQVLAKPAIPSASKPNVIKPSVKPSADNSFNSDSTTSLPPPGTAPLPGDTAPLRKVTTSPFERVRPKSEVYDDDLIDTESPMRHRNSIQERVHHFLNSHDRQHPTVRTAKGYGRFTDSHTNLVDGEDVDDGADMIEFGADAPLKERSRSSGDISAWKAGR